MRIMKTLEEALDFAIDAERISYDLYYQMALDAHNEHTRDLLFGFAAEEEAHKRKLELIKKNHTVSSFKNDHEVFIPVVYREHVRVSPDMGFDELLLFAIKLEDNSASFYLEMAKAHSNPDLKTFFTTMAREEGDHAKRFETIYNETFVRAKKSE